MPKTKTPAKLNIPTATRQARKHVDALMPGCMATVETRGTADPQTLAHLMRTTITFPEGHANRHVLGAALGSLAGTRKVEVFPTHIYVTREV